jgi:hypothetical protein
MRDQPVQTLIAGREFGRGLESPCHVARLSSLWGSWNGQESEFKTGHSTKRMIRGWTFRPSG